MNNAKDKMTSFSKKWHYFANSPVNPRNSFSFATRNSEKAYISLLGLFSDSPFFIANASVRVFDSVGTADTARLLAVHYVRRLSVSPSCDRKALTKSRLRFWFSENPQDSLKTALSRFVNKKSFIKNGFAQVLSNHYWDV